MPTTIPAVMSADADIQIAQGDVRAILNNRDLLTIALFAAIGFALTLGFAVFCPLPAPLAVLALSAS